MLSGLGAHLVLISEREEGRLPELAAVREEVKRDWLLERQKELKESTFRKLLEEYEVVIDQPAPSQRSDEQFADSVPGAAP
jgi:parvulin-like peptidyl-prolyl isomerase